MEKEVFKPIPIQEKIKQIELNNRLDAEKNELEQIFAQRKSPRIESLEQKPYSDDNNIGGGGGGDEKTDDEKSCENESFDFHENGTNGCGTAIPPKPLPRTSRTNSMTESNSIEEMLTSPTPRPQPKPRTTATYKVRLLVVIFLVVFCLFCFNFVHFS